MYMNDQSFNLGFNLRDLLLIKQMSESIGAIKVPGMILTATILTLGALGICVKVDIFSGRPQKWTIQPSYNLRSSIHTLSFFEWA
jgi:hypothetical protein